MTLKNVSDEELKEYLTGLPVHKIKILIDHYSAQTGVNLDNEMRVAINNNLQRKLDEYEINKVCHKCGSIYVIKKGKKPDGIQRYQCRDCNSKFTLFSGTILEKTNWHWDAWVKTLEMTINNLPLESMLNILSHDYGCKGINIKTIWMWRMKLIHALSSFDMPILSGVIQVDETFVRESQKGSRKLESYLNKPDVRKPRYGVQPSKLGVMGPEFVTIVTAIDDRGYSVCKVAALGMLTEDIFLDLFERHLNNPAYICSDGNRVYKNYCEIFDIPHYVKPTNYKETLKTHGYVEKERGSPPLSPDTITNNEKIMEKLYDEGSIDRLHNKGDVRYSEFAQLKAATGLNLGRVNELHKDIKKFINKDMTNVSTKYLQDYIGFFTYIRNWRVENGRYPTSMKDAEQILVSILRKRVNFTMTDIKNAELELPKPTPRYVGLLEEHTIKARFASGNQYFKFNEEDGVRTFNKREYLSDQPKYKLHKICRDNKIRRYKQLALYSLVSEILKLPDVYEIIYKLISEDQKIKISDEDIKAIEAEYYKHH